MSLYCQYSNKLSQGQFIIFLLWYIQKAAHGLASDGVTVRMFSSVMPSIITRKWCLNLHTLVLCCASLTEENNRVQCCCNQPSTRILCPLFDWWSLEPCSFLSNLLLWLSCQFCYCIYSGSRLNCYLMVVMMLHLKHFDLLLRLCRWTFFAIKFIFIWQSQ